MVIKHALPAMITARLRPMHPSLPCNLLQRNQWQPSEHFMRIMAIKSWINTDFLNPLIQREDGIPEIVWLFITARLRPGLNVLAAHLYKICICVMKSKTD